MIPRLFTPLELSQGAVVGLDEAASHHASRVLRLGRGAEVELFDGRGRSAAATIVATSPSTTVRVGQLHPPAAPPAMHLTLAQCISAADKMDWTIEKAVELGVAAIVPLQSHKAIVKLSAERAARRHQHWQRLILAASAQSRQNRLPELLPAIKLGDWLGAGEPRAESPAVDGRAAAASEHGRSEHGRSEDGRSEDGAGGDAPLRLILDPRAPQSLPAVMATWQPAGARQPAPRRVVLLCGPESGFSPAELDQAAQSGWLAAALGPRVLRTETAGLAALAVLQAGWGDLR